MIEFKDGATVHAVFIVKPNAAMEVPCEWMAWVWANPAEPPHRADRLRYHGDRFGLPDRKVWTGPTALDASVAEAIEAFEQEAVVRSREWGGTQIHRFAGGTVAEFRVWLRKLEQEGQVRLTEAPH